MSNILLSTFGTSPDIFDELYYFFNLKDDTKFYDKKSSKYSKILKEQQKLYHLDQMWAIITDQEKAKENLQRWKNDFEKKIIIKWFTLSDISDIDDNDSAYKMRNLIYKAVWEARKECNATNGKLYLSLSGGRKTMSSDMQAAAQIFGCDGLVHILQSGPREKPEYFPLVMHPQKGTYKYLFTEKEANEKIEKNESSTFAQFVDEKLQEANYFIFNQVRSDNYTESNFTCLNRFDSDILDFLKNTTLTTKHNIKKLPKIDLHCHFGGFLIMEEIYAIAKKIAQKPGEQNINFGSIKTWRENKTVEAICESITAYSSTELEKKLFAQLLDEKEFYKIGFEKYEILGDLQGTTILKSKKIIELECSYICDYCTEHNIVYIELRCSPAKYETPDFSSLAVVQTIIDALQNKIKFKLIFTAVRTANFADIKKQIRLVETCEKNIASFENYFAGFDLAGNENAVEAKKLRKLFLPLLEKSYKITIHAGEGVSEDSIWQAVYELNADRIGHGLSLQDNKLIEKLKDRKITVELCPSSNYQIVGFADYTLQIDDTEYPLYNYLQQKLKVCINTDNRGISRTDITNEFYKASAMTKGGLSLWQVLLLIRNSIKATFLSFDHKKELFDNCEQQIMEWVKNEYKK